MILCITVTPEQSLFTKIDTEAKVDLFFLCSICFYFFFFF